MVRGRKIRVLVVDDSLLYREILSRGLSTDPSIEVVARAVDPFDARDKIMQYNPDVITLDVEMPRMNGIEFLKRLIPQHPIPVVVISAVNTFVFDALNFGAVDFVTKPNASSTDSVELFLRNLIHKVKIAANAKVQILTVSEQGAYSLLKNEEAIASKEYASKIEVIAIGSSTGGTEAVASLLKSFDCNAPGIVVAQHMPAGFTKMFAQRLNNITSLEVKEAQTGDEIRTGHVLIAPGDFHMVVKKVGEKLKVDCIKGDKVNGHCPSVDVLFESVAKEIGDKAIGIILTGMGYDGAKGLMAMKRKGAFTIGQDQQSSVVYGMPKAAFELGAVTKQTSICKMTQVINAAISEK